ncbi:MAG: NDMA-dependent alcohol dehydrogenase [Acidimicrobiales bacterium]
MRSEAAVLWATGDDWSVEEIELDPPRGREVLVRLVASGMCHSDEHVVTGDLPGVLPMIGGHEGAGVVEAVGPDATLVEPGDHVVFSFVPSCGTCPSCAAGHSNLCDQGAVLMAGLQLDGTSRHHGRGQDLRTMCLLGTFARHTVVHEWSCVPIPKDLPLEKACLAGCGVPTGWGSAVYAADVRAGDNVAIVGVGGVGSAAVQGARMAGADRIIAVDPVEAKREAAQGFGATHSAASLADAMRVVHRETYGRGCDKVICTMGVGRGELMRDVMALAAKRGRVVVTNLHPWAEETNTIPMTELTLYEKQVVGSIFGSANPRKDIPRLLELYRSGRIDLDGMITRTYPLEQVNQGYDDMRQGRNIRGVLVYE